MPEQARQAFATMVSQDIGGGPINGHQSTRAGR
jgi:hypothetical protein